MLVVQHIYQALFNLTTQEFWKKNSIEYFKDPMTGAIRNPFDKGVVRNLQEALCMNAGEIYQITSSVSLADLRNDSEGGVEGGLRGTSKPSLGLLSPETMASYNLDKDV